MKLKKIPFLIIIFLLCSSSFAQNKSATLDGKNLYDELIKTKIFAINQNKTIQIEDYKSSVIVVLFLASWCSPCVSQAEALRNIQTDFQEQNVRIIGLDADYQDKKDFKIYLKTNKFNYPMGTVNKKITLSLLKFTKIDALPQTIIIDNGEIKDFFVGGGKSTQKIKSSIENILKSRSQN